MIDVIKKVYKYVTKNDYKDWSYRKYSFNLFFCESTDGNLPWNYQVWDKHIEPLIDEILKQSPEYKNTGIRVLKYQKQGDSNYYKDLKLGRLRWDKKSHEKWTVREEDNIHFDQFELWTPIWTICERLDFPPDIFIKIENEKKINDNRDKQFDVFMILAIATDLNIEYKDMIVELSKRMGSLKTVSQIRKWSKSNKDKNWTFHNWIQDTWTNGIYKGQSLHDFDFDKIVFEPYWEIVYDGEKVQIDDI